MCPLHLATRSGPQGKGPAGWRLRVLAELDDSCAVDVTERARASALRLPEREFQLTLKEIAILNGVSKQRVQQELRSGLEKLRAILKIEIDT